MTMGRVYLPALAKAALLIAGLTVPLSAVSAKTPPTEAPVFTPAAAQGAQPAAAAAADVPVPFAGFNYLLDPNCLDQLYIIGVRSVQDPATGADLSFVTTLVFLKTGGDWSDWIVIPQGENRATGAVAGKPLGARLCVGEGGSK